MNPDEQTLREDAISFGQVETPAEEEADGDETLNEGDRDPNAQPISNRPGDAVPAEEIDPEPGNTA